MTLQARPSELPSTPLRYAHLCLWHGRRQDRLLRETLRFTREDKAAGPISCGLI